MVNHCLGVIGTDTGVGKSLCTALLGRKLKENNISLLLIKAVQTGCFLQADRAELCAPDIELYKDVDCDLNVDTCYKFAPACSPHLAAEKIGVKLSAAQLASDIFVKLAKTEAEIVLLEGSGGFLTPLNQMETLADAFKALAAKIDLSLILVVANKLGALNHALLTWASIKEYGLPLAGFVVTDTVDKSCNFDGLEGDIARDNLEFLKGRLPGDYLAKLPFNPGANSDNVMERQRAYQELSNALNIDNLLIKLGYAK